MTVVTSDIFFCFGPTTGSYVLDTKRKFRRRGLPPRMDAELTNVRKIYYAAFDNDGAACFAYKDLNGKNWHWESTALRNRYPSLQQALDENLPETPYEEVSVVLGDGSYAACFPSVNKARWRGLPSVCEKSIRSIDAVRHVAFGAGNDCDYIILAAENRYRIQYDYAILNKTIDDAFAAGKTLTFVTLNPWRKNEFFVVFNNNQAFFAIDSSLESNLRNVLAEEGIQVNAVERYNPTRTVISNSNLADRNRRSFLRELPGHIIGGATSGVVGTIVTTVLTGMGVCIVM